MKKYRVSSSALPSAQHWLENHGILTNQRSVCISQLLGHKGKACQSFVYNCQEKWQFSILLCIYYMGKLGYLLMIIRSIRKACVLQLFQEGWQGLWSVLALQVSSWKAIEVRSKFQLWKTTQSKYPAEISPANNKQRKSKGHHQVSHFPLVSHLDGFLFAGWVPGSDGKWETDGLQTA